MFICIAVIFIPVKLAQLMYLYMYPNKKQEKKKTELTNAFLKKTSY